MVCVFLSYVCHPVFPLHCCDSCHSLPKRPVSLVQYLDWVLVILVCECRVLHVCPRCASVKHVRNVLINY